MQVIKRNGKKEPAKFDKVVTRINKLMYGLDKKFIKPHEIAQKVIQGLYDGVSTREIDTLAAETAASMTVEHHDYAKLAARIAVSSLHKHTSDVFTDVIESLHKFKHAITKEDAKLINDEFYAFVMQNKEVINNSIDYNRDYDFDYFGFKTLERAYLLKVNGKIVERPQHMYMRVAMALHLGDLDKIIETYEFLSQKFYTHATPTLYNAGTPRQQLASCFLLSFNQETDSIHGIYKMLSDVAALSQHAGGIGLSVTDIRSKGSYIKGTGGYSNGLVPMLRAFDATARYVDQCFHKDTVVFTKNGPKAIHSIEENEEVLTHEGRFKKVLKKLEYPSIDKSLYKVKIEHGNKSIIVTEEHPVLALTRTSKFEKPSFTEVKELKIGDYVGFPIPSFVEDNIHITEDDCLFYGIVLRDGHFSVENNISFYYDSWNKNSSAVKFVKNYLETKNIEFIENINDNILTIKAHNVINKIPFTREDFYDENKDKKISNKVINLPDNKLSNIVKGLLVGNRFLEQKLSKGVIDAISYMVLRLGVLPESKSDDESFIFFKKDNYLWTKIKDIEKTKDDSLVYDFEVEDDHTYVTELGIAHNGGGKRKGSFAIYIEPWHADIYEFLDLKKNHGKEEMRARDLFYALWVCDLFMKRVVEDGEWTLLDPAETRIGGVSLSELYGEKFEELYVSLESQGIGKKIKARDLWNKIIETQIETGMPYILYKDHVNNKSNQKNLGTIKNSNLCVAPETLVLTKEGHFPIADLSGEEVELWNGFEFSKVKVFQTGENQKLLKVVLSNGDTLECTPYHKWHVVRNYAGKVEIVETHQLKEGDKLIKFELPTLEGSSAEDILYPYTHGAFCADGTYQKNAKPRISLYDYKKELIKHLEIKSSSFIEDASGRINCMLPDELKEKYYVPINATVENKLRWLEGYLDFDGTVARNGDNDSIQVVSIHKNFLLEVKRLLETLGVTSKIVKGMPDKESLLPDGKGGYKLFDTKETVRLLITSNGVFKLLNLGFSPKRLTLKGNKPNREASAFIKVVSVIDENRYDDTYCFTEPLRNLGYFNGIVTGQCAEIVEFSSPEECATCNLASLNLSKFVFGNKFDFNKLYEVVKIAIKNLDRVIDINYYPIPEAKNSNLKHRPIGLGVQGLADVFAMLKMPFTSDKAKKLNREIFETIYYASVESSCELAQEYGTYSTYEGSPMSQGLFQYDLWNDTPTTKWDWSGLKQKVAKHGLRNSLLTAVMPTASTSQLLENQESIEPFTSNIYTRRTLSGEFVVINRYLVNDLIKLGLWDENMRQRIIAMNGSIQDSEIFPEIPEHIKDIYKTVWEIKMKDYIDMSADRGSFICQTQSLNLYYAEPSVNKLSSAQIYAHGKGLKTGVYYTRTRPATDAIKFTVDPSLLKKKAIEQKVTLSDIVNTVKEHVENESNDDVLGYTPVMCSIDNPDCEACSA